MTATTPESVRDADPVAVPAPVHGLTPAQMVDLFPFHLVVDHELSIVQAGRSARHIFPQLSIGRKVAELLLPRRPFTAWTPDALLNSANVLVMAECIGSGIVVRGQIVGLADRPRHYALLVTPWIEDAAGASRAGLSWSDFALHDGTLDLIQVIQSKRIANDDLRRLAALLAHHRSDLQSVNAELSERNRALEETTRILAEAQEIAGLGNWSYDAEADNLQCSDEIGNICGVGADFEWTSLNAWKSLVVPADRLRVERMINAAASGVLDLEFRIDRADGTRRYLHLRSRPDEASHQPARYFGTLQDVTARRKSERMMRRQLAAVERLRADRDTILELSPDGFLSFDEEGHPAYSNPAAATLLGVSTHDLQAMTQSEVEERLAALCRHPALYSPLRHLDAGSSDMLELHGGRTWLKRAVFAVTAADGVRLGRVVYLRDVTGELELARLRSEFLATAAHELRTPISSIHGFSELLLTRDLAAPIRQEVVERIHSQSNFVVRMVNDLLDLERLASATGRQELQIGAHPLLPLLRDVADGLLVDGDARRVTLVDGHTDCQVKVDTDKFAQALGNVLANALRYSRDQGGPVELSVVPAMGDERTHIGIEVADRGIGMTPAQVARVFDRFYRADPTRAVQGTGLGMTLVKEILESMDGRVSVASVAGHGTTVTLWLPVAHP